MKVRNSKHVFLKTVAGISVFLLLSTIFIGCGSADLQSPSLPSPVTQTTEPRKTEPATPVTESTANPTIGSKPAPTQTPQPEQPSESIPEASGETTVGEETDMVWISKTGRRYHSCPDCSNMKDPSHVTEEDAIDMGLTPCSKCC